MINKYSINDNTIMINAPGSSINNRIKNHLIWDLNSYLYDDYYLYCFEIVKNTNNMDYSYVLPVNNKYAVFYSLDNDFISSSDICDTVIKKLKNEIDPTNRIDYEVFKESMNLENVDIEYIAVCKNIDIFNNNISFKLKSEFEKWVQSTPPIYVSLFGAKELKITVNNMQLFDRIIAIVHSHCTKEI